MKDDCLHCALAKAAEKWFKSHNASGDDTAQMIGNFAVELLAKQPQFKGLTVQVIVLGIKFTSDDERQLH